MSILQKCKVFVIEIDGRMLRGVLYFSLKGDFFMEKILQVKNIEKYYGNKSNLTKAIDNISFEVSKGEFVGIMGASRFAERRRY